MAPHGSSEGAAGAAQTENQLANDTSSHTYRAYSLLRDAILGGTLRPGERIKIDTIRETTGIGMSPVREALSLLSSEGLVERRDQRGFWAAAIGEDDFKELLRTRSWLEEQALRQSIKRGCGEWQADLVAAEARLSAAPRSTRTDRFQSNDAWELAHRDFHRALIAACGSRYMLRFCSRLYDLNIRYRNIAGRLAYPARQIDTEHRNIMELAIARDADAAVAALITHYETTGTYVARRLAEMAI